MRETKRWLLLWTLGLALGLAACTQDVTIEAESASEPTATPTALAPDLAGTSSPTVWVPDPQDTPTPRSVCPEVDLVYRLDYVHEVVQDMPRAHYEHNAEPGAAFFLTIHADGTADSDGYENLVLVSITGTFEDCVLEGTGELSADISGRCTEGIATLQITEHWETLATTVTCPDQAPQSTSLEGFFSAPEDTFDFKLQEEGDTQILEADTGILSVYYSWTLLEHGLAIVPIP